MLTVGDIIFKIWSGNNRPAFYVVGLAMYMVGLVCLVQSFKSQNIAVASAIFVIVNIVTLSLVSWFYFKETLSMMQLMGMMLSLIHIL